MIALPQKRTISWHLVFFFFFHHKAEEKFYHRSQHSEELRILQRRTGWVLPFMHSGMTENYPQEDFI